MIPIIFKFFFIIVSILVITTPLVSAHCPLCTIGAGAAAAGAVWLGVHKIVVVLFIGAFALSMALWFARIIKKKYIPFQKGIITTVVFLTTLLPLLPLFKFIGPLYLPLGEYGLTYAINYSLISSLLGAIIVGSTPFLSKKITVLRKKKIPYQGIILTFILLILIGAIIQITI